MEAPVLTLLLFLHLNLFAALACNPAKSRYLGVNYGLHADNLPSPKQAVKLIQSTYIRKVKLFEPDTGVLQALARSGLETTVTVPNERVYEFGQEPILAFRWVRENVLRFVRIGTRIDSICIGNEILINIDRRGSKTKKPHLQLLRAMTNVHNALVHYGLHKRVKVNTPHALNVLVSSYPPSTGTFNTTLMEFLGPVLRFLNHTSEPFMVNVYPYFAYRDNTKIDINYALFRENAGVHDQFSGLNYTNLLYAQVDAVYAALDRAGFPKMRVAITETGWPSGGNPKLEPAATPGNARAFVRGLVHRVRSGRGTPLRPRLPLEAFIFALFDENKKVGPQSERHYGLFHADMSSAYDSGVQPEGDDRRQPS